jgi:hypothetical protein
MIWPLPVRVNESNRDVSQSGWSLSCKSFSLMELGILLLEELRLAHIAAALRFEETKKKFPVSVVFCLAFAIS